MTTEKPTFTHKILRYSDNEDDGEEAESISTRSSSQGYPEAFIEAVREAKRADINFDDDYGSLSGSSLEESEKDDSTISSLISTTMTKRGSWIPESVLAALTGIQRSQLLRIRKEASFILEGILRNVVKTVDRYKFEQASREILVPAKKMIGVDEEEEEEKRIKAEIRKILRGHDKHERLQRDQSQSELLQGTTSESEDQKEEEDEEIDEEEEQDGITHYKGEQETPVCQVMLNIIDDLNGISDERERILKEVSEWLESYPANSLPDFGSSTEDEHAKIADNDYERLFLDWDVHKRIRRLTLISEEMGLVKVGANEKDDEGAANDRRSALQEKVKKQRSKYIPTKVYDPESLCDPKVWSQASRAIVSVLEEAAATTSNSRMKQTFSNAQKQFTFMATLAEKRHEEKTKLALQVYSLNGKLAKEKNETKGLRKKKYSLEAQIEKQEDELSELKRDIEVKDRMLNEQAVQIYDLEETQREMNSSSQPPVVQLPLPPPPTRPQPKKEAAPAPVASELPTASEPPTNTLKNASTNEKDNVSQENQTGKAKTVKQTKKRGSLATQENSHKVPKSTKETHGTDKRTNQKKEDAMKSTVIMSLKEAKAELEEIRKAGEAREERIKELNLKLKSETEKFGQEKAKLLEEIQFHQNQTESAKKQLELEQEAWEQVKSEMMQEKDNLTNEIQAKEEIINYQEQRIQEVAREMTLSLMRAGLKESTGRADTTDKLLESKQILAKLHLKYEYEMEKLREFVDREAERHRADMRRMELDHKRELHIIYRDTSVILRAVNRFKECLATLLDRENLPDAAHGIRNIASLLEDESATDPHIKLARMAGNVTELMVQMEFKMSQALINKRMEIKETSLAKTFLSKDLEAREDLLRKARELGNLQAEKLKQVREELSYQEAEILKLKHSETDKYVDMMERNKELTRQNQTLNRTLTVLQKETQEESTRLESEVEEIKKTNSQLEKTMEEQEIIIATLRAENQRIVDDKKMFLKKSDMMRNIKLLNDALAAKKISKEKHMVAMTMIEKTMEVSGFQFVQLVQKYVVHRSWKKICEALRTYHKRYKRPPNVEEYLKFVDKNIEEKKERLKEKKAELLQKRTEMYLHFRNMCTELSKESGVTLIRPVVRKDHSTSQTTEQEWSVGRKKTSNMHSEKSKTTSRKIQIPIADIGEIKGMKFVAPQLSEHTSWEFPPIQAAQSAIVTPKILDLDVNKARESCQRVLTSKSCENFDKRSGPGFTRIPWYRRQKEREALFSLPPIASLYPEN